MRRGTANRESNDDPGDEAIQTAELSKLQRQLRVMEGDRRAYAEESCNILRKQESEKEALLDENEEITTVLRLAQSEKNENMDYDNTARLIELIETLDEINSQSKKERKAISNIDKQIKKLEKKTVEQSKKQGGTTEVMSERAVQKEIRVKENRLDKAMVKFNEQLAVNAYLRQEIDHLRQERAVFDGLSKKLTKELEDAKSQMDVVIREAAHAYEERDEAQTKMLALKERSEKDIAQHELEMKDLQRVIDHDNRLKEFMMVKSQDRAEYKEEEESKKNKNAKDKDTDAEKEQIEKYEQAFQRIQEATGEDDIDVIVDNFMMKEDENFALFNYVNELNEEVEQLQEEISGMQKEIQAFQDEDIRMLETRKNNKADIEVKMEKAIKETEAAQSRIGNINDVLDQLRDGVSSLFDTINCDSVTVTSLLGSEEGVSNKNILKYMGIIEQKTMEMLQQQQYVQMRRNPPKPEKKEKKGDPTPPVPQATRVDAAPPISITAPTSQDDEDDSVNIEEIEIRPLTQEELRAMANRNITRRHMNAHVSNQSTQSRRTKSPRQP